MRQNWAELIQKLETDRVGGKSKAADSRLLSSPRRVSIMMKL
jgi:hypothetical protein